MTLNDLLLTVTEKLNKSFNDDFSLVESGVPNLVYHYKCTNIFCDISKYLTEEYSKDYFCLLHMVVKKNRNTSSGSGVLVKKDSEIYKILKENKYTFPYRTGIFYKPGAEVDYSIFLVSQKDIEVLKDVRHSNIDTFMIGVWKKLLGNIDLFVESFENKNELFLSWSKHKNKILNSNMFYDGKITCNALKYCSLLGRFGIREKKNVVIRTDNKSTAKVEIKNILVNKFKSTLWIMNELKYCSKDYKTIQCILHYMCDGVTEFVFNNSKVYFIDGEDILLTGALGV